ncbi:MAG: hypothetical protein LBG80_09750 [Bacteroidales bacterium]|jgi:hypothetical protein|nr:hypothetical protein [Bacteroidales bacterium]
MQSSELKTGSRYIWFIVAAVIVGSVMASCRREVIIIKGDGNEVTVNDEGVRVNINDKDTCNSK